MFWMSVHAVSQLSKTEACVFKDVTASLSVKHYNVNISLNEVSDSSFPKGSLSLPIISNHPLNQ